MSHTLSKVNLGNNALSLVTIIDYVTGGESFTLSELGLTSISSVLFLASQGSTQYIPILSGNKVILQARPGFEIPSTTGLNYTFAAIVQG